MPKIIVTTGDGPEVLPGGQKKTNREQVPSGRNAPEKEPAAQAANETLMQDGEGVTVEESLNEIYQDEQGNIVDVTRIEKKKRPGILFWFPAGVFLFSFLLSAGWYYLEYTDSRQAGQDVEITITASEENVRAGTPFVYTISYTNLMKVPVNAKLKASFPEGFIYDNSNVSPIIASSTSNYEWDLGTVESYGGGTIKVGGMLIARPNDRLTANAELTYKPSNISSEFMKAGTITVVMQDVGISAIFDQFSSVVLGSENEVIIRLKSFENSSISEFLIAAEPQNNTSVGFISKSADNASSSVEHSAIKPNVWKVLKVSPEGIDIPIRFIVNEKQADTLEMKFIFSYAGNDGKEYPFFEDTRTFALMRNELNINLVVNGSNTDQGVDLGKTLQYSIFYSNRGDSDAKSVILQAVIEGGLIDWSSLKAEQGGKVTGNSVTWTSTEIPDLATLAPNSEGTINFSVKTLPPEALPEKHSSEIKSYVQYSFGGSIEASSSTDKISNIIRNKINSELNFEESLRYFDDDNIAVGYGPLPPKAGEATSYKVYWKVRSSINEISDAKVVVNLPAYVKFDGKENKSVGDLVYDESAHSVTWSIGKLPVLAEMLEASFNVSFTPAEGDRNKVAVILPGTTATGVDTATNAEIEKTTGARTTKLEDDEVGKSDGIIQ